MKGIPPHSVVRIKWNTYKAIRTVLSACKQSVHVCWCSICLFFSLRVTMERMKIKSMASWPTVLKFKSEESLTLSVPSGSVGVILVFCFSFSTVLLIRVGVFTYSFLEIFKEQKICRFFYYYSCNYHESTRPFL